MRFNIYERFAFATSRQHGRHFALVSAAIFISASGQLAIAFLALAARQFEDASWHGDDEKHVLSRKESLLR